MTVLYLLLLSLFLLSSFFIIINFIMCRFNEYAGFTWFSCHAGFVRLLLDGCYGRWFVYVKQRNATASCWALCAGSTCTLLRTSFVDRNTGRQSNRSGKYPRCSDLSLRGKNMHSMKARFVLLICKLSPGHSGLSRCSISCRKLVWWAHGIYPYWWLGWKGYVRRFPWRI